MHPHTSVMRPIIILKKCSVSLYLNLIIQWKEYKFERKNHVQVKDTNPNPALS